MTVVLAFLLAFGIGVNALHHPLADDPPREHRPHRRTQDADRCRRRRRGSRAENANRAKSRFLAAASHDLRQPLHALGLFAAALSVRVRDAGSRPLVGSINASVEALERLFAQLLDLSRLEAGALHAVPTRLPLAPLFARLAADFAPQADAAGLRLRFRPRGSRWSPTRCCWSACCATSSCNALRYTAPGGVLVAARRRAGAVRIDVVDTGVGIAAEDRERVFERLRPGLRRSAAPRRRPRHGAGALDRPAPRRTPATPRGARLDARPRLALLDRAAAGGARRRRRPAGHRGARNGHLGRAGLCRALRGRARRRPGSSRRHARADRIARRARDRRRQRRWSAARADRPRRRGDRPDRRRPAPRRRPQRPDRDRPAAPTRRAPDPRADRVRRHRRRGARRGRRARLPLLAKPLVAAALEDTLREMLRAV